MIILAILLQIAAEKVAPPDFNSSGYPTQAFLKRVDAALDNGLVAWLACGRQAAKKLQKGRDAAPVIADAALTECSRHEQPLKELNANQIAITTSINTGFEFNSLVRQAQARRDEFWEPARTRVRDILISAIVTERAK